MIFTYPQDHPSASPTAINVNPDKPINLRYVKHVFDLSRCGDVVITYPGKNWWTQPEVGRFFDFLGFRGADIIHIVGKFDTPHSAYLAARLETLYDSDVLDEWAQVG